MRIIFLGTPEFSVPSLDAIFKSKHELVGVITRIDKSNERGNKVEFSPVKKYALKNNIPLFQFAKLSRDGVETIKELKPDLMVTASYGQIISQEILDIPTFGIINVHGSLLPMYRGASPIQTAILNGDSKTGVTIMKTEAGLDTGDIILTEEMDIKPNETAGELGARMSVVGANLLIRVIEQIENGTATYTKQSFIESSVTTRINKEDGKIIWSKSARQIKCQVLAQNPSPISFSYLNGELCKIYRAIENREIKSTNKPVGTVIEPTHVKKGIFVQTGSGVLEILELQKAGGKVLSAKDFINGRKIKLGDKFDTEINVETVAPTMIE